MLKFLHQQPAAPTMAAWQAQVDAFDRYYTTERAHQYHPGNTTPQEAWNATPKASTPHPPAPDVRAGQELKAVSRIVRKQGIVTIIGTHFQIGKDQIGRQVRILHNDTIIMFFDDQGTEIISHPIPPKGTFYVGNGKPQGSRARYQLNYPKSEVSTKS